MALGAEPRGHPAAGVPAGRRDPRLYWHRRGPSGSTRLGAPDRAVFCIGVAPYDPVTFGAVVAVLASVALAACGIPARRAIRIAPATALRS